MHDVAHPQQPAPEPAARMKQLEIGGGKALALEQRERQRIAERHHHRRRGRRRQTHRAGLGGSRQQQHDIGRLGEGRSRAAGDRDQRNVEPARIGDDVGEFGRFAGIRQGEDGVLGADHAEIAVARLGGVDELRRRAGRGEGRGDLAGDMAALAHPGDDDAPAHGGARVDRSSERAVERFGEAFEPGDLGADDAAGNGEIARSSVASRTRFSATRKSLIAS